MLKCKQTQLVNTNTQFVFKYTIGYLMLTAGRLIV